MFVFVYKSTSFAWKQKYDHSQGRCMEIMTNIKRFLLLFKISFSDGQLSSILLSRSYAEWPVGQRLSTAGAETSNRNRLKIVTILRIVLANRSGSTNRNVKKEQ